jgi:hypothetical protein
LAPLRDQLAGQLVWRVPQASGTVTNTIQFHRDIPAADAVIRIKTEEGRSTMSAARKTPQPGRPAWMNMISPGDLSTLSARSLASPAELGDWMATGPPPVQPLIIADAGLNCGELLRLIRPMIDACLRINVVGADQVP